MVDLLPEQDGRSRSKVEAAASPQAMFPSAGLAEIDPLAGGHRAVARGIGTTDVRGQGDVQLRDGPAATCTLRLKERLGGAPQRCSTDCSTLGPSALVRPGPSFAYGAPRRVATRSSTSSCRTAWVSPIPAATRSDPRYSWGRARSETSGGRTKGGWGPWLRVRAAALRAPREGRSFRPQRAVCAARSSKAVPSPLATTSGCFGRAAGEQLGWPPKKGGADLGRASRWNWLRGAAFNCCQIAVCSAAGRPCPEGSAACPRPAPSTCRPVWREQNRRHSRSGSGAPQCRSGSVKSAIVRSRPARRGNGRLPAQLCVGQGHHRWALERSSWGKGSRVEVQRRNRNPLGTSFASWRIVNSPGLRVDRTGVLPASSSGCQPSTRSSTKQKSCEFWLAFAVEG